MPCFSACGGRCFSACSRTVLYRQREISQLAQQLSGGLDAAVLLSLRYPNRQREPQHRSKSKNSSLLLFLFSLLLFFLSSLLLHRHHGQGGTAMEMDSPLKDPPMGGLQ